MTDQTLTTGRSLSEFAAQLASGTIRSDEAEEIWKLLRASGESDI